MPPSATPAGHDVVRHSTTWHEAVGVVAAGNSRGKRRERMAYKVVARLHADGGHRLEDTETGYGDI